MNGFSRRTFWLTLLISALAWGGVAGLATLIGTTSAMDWGTVQTRLLNAVLPAGMVGAGLAGAGVVYQAILRNPLADPYLLGVSSGAMLGSYCWYLPVLSAISSIALISPQVMAFVGAILAMLIVLTCAGWRGRIDPTTAVLIGAIVNTLFGAVFMLLNTLYRDLSGVGGSITFLVGDLQSNVLPSHMRISAIIIGCGLLVMLAFSSSLNVIRLSDEEARSIGVRVQRVRWIGLVVASLVTAAVVAVSGPIGFVGLIAPHLVRAIVGNDLRRVLPLAVALGAILVTGADALARFLAADQNVGTRIPVGVLMALIGGPAFILLFLRSVRRR